MKWLEGMEAVDFENHKNGKLRKLQFCYSLKGEREKKKNSIDGS